MELVYKISYYRMQDYYLPKLVQAIQFVSEDNLWKQGESVNSIGGIVLHICEHILRNNSRYKDPNIVFEKGIEEYFPTKRQRNKKKKKTVGEKHLYKIIKKKGILIYIVYYI